jgi:hypothetical protein
MKRHVPVSIAVIALCLAAGLVSCQRIFSSSPLASVLSDPDYHLPESMTLDEKLEVSREAISIGNADLAGRMLDNLMADETIPEDRLPEVFKTIVSLALLTTNISGAVSQAIVFMPGDESDPTEAQQAAIEAAMQGVSCASDSLAYQLFAGMALVFAFDPGNAVYAGISGSDAFFAGLTLIQTVARGKTGIDIASLDTEDQNTVTMGALLVLVGTERLTAEGVPQDVIDSLAVFADIGP